VGVCACIRHGPPQAHDEGGRCYEEVGNVQQSSNGLAGRSRQAGRQAQWWCRYITASIHSRCRFAACLSQRPPKQILLSRYTATASCLHYSNHAGCFSLSCAMQQQLAAAPDSTHSIAGSPRSSTHPARSRMHWADAWSTRAAAARHIHLQSTHTKHTHTTWYQV
jgi:hypothetical protein